MNGLDAGTSRKHVVVLGDDPKPRQTGRQENFVYNNKPRPLYNHCKYAISHVGTG